jgi:hypothetical protein
LDRRYNFAIPTNFGGFVHGNGPKVAFHFGLLKYFNIFIFYFFLTSIEAYIQQSEIFEGNIIFLAELALAKLLKMNLL